jgi:hypothetical protein
MVDGRPDEIPKYTKTKHSKTEQERAYPLSFATSLDPCQGNTNNIINSILECLDMFRSGYFEEPSTL